jgi:hypothetical protein
VFVKFRRKSADAETAETGSAEAETTEASVAGPFDIDDLPADDETPRMDLGALLVAPADGFELRLQVEEDSEQVQAVVVAGPDGALELRAFAAPRNGDLWSDVRPRIAADFAQRGGTATEREGRFGTELLCQVTVRMDDGRTGTQPSRVIGVNGPRWMLRATLLGRPAQEPETAGRWEDLIEQVAVRRGAQAMPVGSELPLTLPPREQLVERHAN